MKLLEFLADLATDTQLMSAFRTAPRAVLSARGLDETDQALLLSGDPIALRTAMAAESGAQPRWIERSPGAPSMELFPPNPNPMPEEFPRPEEFPMPEEFPPPKPRPGEPAPRPEEFPGPDQVASFPSLNMMELFGPDEPAEPEEPDDGPEAKVKAPRAANSPTAFPSLNMMELFNPHEPDAPSEPQEPDDGPEAFRNAPEGSGSHEAESVHFEPIDLERDLAQDAVLTGMTSRAAESDPAGVWSGKGLTVVGMGMRAGLHMTV